MERDGDIGALAGAQRVGAAGEHAQRGVRNRATGQRAGIGIPDSELPHIFERFFQGAGTGARSFEGSGIGLALVHELVKMHGGSIKVQTSAAHGTSFTVSIPFGSAHLPSLPAAAGQSGVTPASRVAFEEDAEGPRLRAGVDGTGRLLHEGVDLLDRRGQAVEPVRDVRGREREDDVLAVARDDDEGARRDPLEHVRGLIGALAR